MAAARDPAAEVVAPADRPRAERNRARVVKRGTPQRPLGLTGRDQRLPPDEVALVERDGEADPRLERCVIRRDVRAPHAIALLEPQGVDRLVTTRDEPVVPSRLPDRVPQREAELGTAVQLPPELTDVRDAQREAGNPPDRE